MHESSYERMREFVLKYLNPRKKLKILDVGSYDVGGNYKKLFDNPNWEYYGGDIEILIQYAKFIVGQRMMKENLDTTTDKKLLSFDDIDIALEYIVKKRDIFFLSIKFTFLFIIFKFW